MSWTAAKRDGRKAISVKVDTVAGIEAPYGAKLTLNADSPFAGNEQLLQKIAEAVKAGSDTVKLVQKKTNYAVLIKNKAGEYVNIYCYLTIYKGTPRAKSAKNLTLDDLAI